MEKEKESLLVMFLLCWFEEHPKERKEVKEYLLQGFSKKEINELFKEEKVEEDIWS